MEKINIAELLRNCPSGMELDCTMYDNLYFNQIYDDDGGCIYEIGCYTIVDEIRTTVNFTKFGTFNTHANSKCVIFPKGKTTWEGFHRPFQDGDILAYTSSHTTVFIYRNKDNKPKYTTSFYVGYSIGESYCSFHIYNKDTAIALNDNYDVRLATEEEKEKLFKAIKDNGYKWNYETKTLEKLIVPKFKVGDRIKYINGKNKDGVKEGIILSITNDTYDVAVTNDMGIFVPISEQDEWELVPNKFDINTLKPFDNCKYSLDNGRTWKFAQYWYIMDNYKIDDIKIELWQD